MQTILDEAVANQWQVLAKGALLIDAGAQPTSMMINSPFIVKVRSSLTAKSVTLSALFFIFATRLAHPAKAVKVGGS